MKKIIILICIFIFSFVTLFEMGVFAQGYNNPGPINLPNIRGGGPNKGVGCINTSSVPIDSQTNTFSDSPSGSFTCIEHNYYTPSTYTRNTISNGITLCDGEDRVISKLGTQIICRRWDDGSPTLNTGLVAYSHHNIWTNQNGTVTFGANDVNTSSVNGTVKSDIQTTRYCWGSSCSLGNKTDGTAANSVTVNTQQNTTLRFRSWDNNDNASIISSVVVKIDKTLPSVVSLTHYNGWTNQSSQTVNFSLNDAGGSGLEKYTLQRRVSTNNPTFAPYGGTWQNIAGHIDRSISGMTHNGSYNYTGLNNQAYQFRIRVWDTAGNVSSWVLSGDVTKIDTVAPNILADITNNNPLHLLANNNYTYSVLINERSGSPISSFRYRKENSNNNSLSSNITDTSSPWSFSWDIQYVDTYRTSNGGRLYTVIVTQICDEAGNCSSGTQSYDHYVYANTLSTTSSVPTNELSSPVVADGNPKNIVINLQDSYGNAIVPASGIERNIDMNIYADNSLRRDQYLNTSNATALYAGTNTTPIAISPSALRRLDDRSSTDGNFIIPFYIYAPTSNESSLVPGSASINRIEYDIDSSISIQGGDSPQNQLVSGTSIIIQAQPLYTTVFSGDMVTQGFIEGAGQNLNITVSKANGTSTTGNSLRAEFGDVSGGNNVENTRYGFTVNGTSIAEGQQASWSSTTQLSSSLNTLNNRTTLMTQDGPVDSETFSYFASIIKYSISGKTIIYPGDIVGKNNYHGVAGVDNSYQEGIKIVGNVSSSNTGAITTDQFTNDVRVIGGLDTPSFRENINKRVYGAIKNIPPKTLGSRILSSADMNASLWNNNKYDIGNISSRGTALFGDEVLYFGDGNLVTINGASNLEGEKTVIVENGDIFIAGDIENTDNDGVLGIIVINGDILIDTGVTDIHAVLYTDKSIFSSTNGIDRLDGTVSASDLANQLYVKGSVFSENTIGGSRKTPLLCPYYVNVTCSSTIAQSYDLNYLRRYYIFDSDSDGIPETPSGAQSRADGQVGFEQYPVIIDYNPQIQQSPPPLFDQ